MVAEPPEAAATPPPGRPRDGSAAGRARGTPHGPAGRTRRLQAQRRTEPMRGAPPFAPAPENPRRHGTVRRRRLRPRQALLRSGGPNAPPRGAAPNRRAAPHPLARAPENWLWFQARAHGPPPARPAQRTPPASDHENPHRPPNRCQGPPQCLNTTNVRHDDLHSFVILIIALAFLTGLSNYG